MLVDSPLIEDNPNNPNLPHAPPSARQTAAEFTQNLSVGVSALLQTNVPRRLFKASPGQLLLLCLALWLISALDDFAETNFVGNLTVWGIISDAALNYFWLFAVGIVTLMLNNSRYFLPLAAGTASVSVAISLLWIPVAHLWESVSVSSYQANFARASWFVFIIQATAFFRILSWYCYIDITRRGALSLVYAGIIFLSIWYFPPQPLFYEPWDEQLLEADFDVEDVYYAQANLMSQGLYEIAAENPGQVDVFSIGFAAYGEQDVFKREVQSALGIIAERFDSQNKTLALINNRASLTDMPLASGHNLRRAIREISAKMNLDEDILLLFLSSHGSEDGSISVQLGDLELNQLNAQDVASALDESQVYWRIVIISACYSGSFIDELKSPTSLIITAAASDKASFGCDHTRDWTYFGEAFFSESLPNNPTLIASFESAKDIVSKRERTEGKEPSNPQLWLGEAMKAYLTLHAL